MLTSVLGSATWLLLGGLAQGGAGDGSADLPSQEPNFRWQVEAKAHWRDSEDVRFRSPFPFDPAAFPVGQDGVFLRTVDPGSHVEVSTVSFTLNGRFGGRWSWGADIDLIDLYERNPTSDDREVDIDELWLRWGEEPTPFGALEAGGWVKLGKFGKFERQDLRGLESYGLVSTAFNRFEDFGLELGASFGRHLYAVGTISQGNPLFLRDPNALAGDNGTPRSLERPSNPERWSGVPILYDAEIEDLDFDRPEIGLGLGMRWASELRDVTADLLLWRYERKLQDTVDLEGTLYGGDLDLLLGPLNSFGLPVSGDVKEELGANLRLDAGGLALFGQWVDQEVAGMDRTGFEVEAAYTFRLPAFAAVAGRQVFSHVTPVLRYSEIDPEFEGGGAFPSPSVRWLWDKLDYGVRVGLWQGLDLTLERSDNTFVVRGRDEEMAETLFTLRWRWDSQR